MDSQYSSDQRSPTSRGTAFSAYPGSARGYYGFIRDDDEQPEARRPNKYFREFKPKKQDDCIRRITGVVVNVLFKGRSIRAGPEWDAVVPGAFRWNEKKVMKKERINIVPDKEMVDYNTHLLWQRLYQTLAPLTP